MATIKPIKIDDCHERPKIRAIKYVSRILSPTCRVPPIIIGFQRRFSLSRESSRPIPKRSRATPISAITSTLYISLIRANPRGPISIPAKIKAAMAGILSRCRKVTTITATARMTTKSRK